MQGKANKINSDLIYPEREYIFGGFSERLWAYLTIQQLLENRLDHLNSACWLFFCKKHQDLKHLSDITKSNVKTTIQLTPHSFYSPSDIGTQQEKDAKTAKALELSLQYSFVTPLTSMVVTKPETEDGPSSPLIADKLTEGKGNATGHV